MTINDIFAGESANLEFKEQVPLKSDKYMKTVVAFANGNGGKLIFGVQDGTLQITGFNKNEIFQKMDSITNAIYDSCEPKITPNVAIQEINGHQIIVVEIPSGMQRPYYIKSLGIADGTFIRVSGTTRRAERYMLQELILDGTNRCFDQQSSNQIVTEQEISSFCDHLYHHALKLCPSEISQKQLQKVSKSQLLSWKLLTEKDGEYIPSNGYLLLNGTENLFPEATIQCAVFKGNVRDIFINRKEFSGPIYQQIEDAYHFVLQNIKLGSRIQGLYREDIYELPIKTIRELIANAVCHRSYLSPGKIQVALFDNRLEVTSPGMLDNDITIEKMKCGLSKIRNKGIAAAFSYMNIIEAWGSGIPRIFQETKKYGLKDPELIDMGSDFRVNLFRPVSNIDAYGIINPVIQDTTQATQDTTQATQDTKIKNVSFSDIDKCILKLLKNNPSITQKELALELDWKIDRVKYYLNKFKRLGVIERIGSSQKGHWKLLINIKDLCL